MDVIFFGSDDFAAAHLEQLKKSRHRVRAVVTKPDTRQGRGMKLVLSPIKILAAELDIDCLQPQTLQDTSFAPRLKTYGADVLVVVAYGKILTAAILDIPKIYSVNVHASLLPKYRGAAPIHWAIINGEEHTGISVQKMALELDAGEVIAQENIDIPPDITTPELRERMMPVGARLLISTLDQIEEGRVILKPQDHSKTTYAPKLCKDMGRIDWNKDAKLIYNQVRGLTPWPGAYTFYKGKTLKIVQADIGPSRAAADVPGTVIAVDKHGFTVACKDRSLVVRKMQLESAKAMTAADFLAGHRVSAGQSFT